MKALRFLAFALLVLSAGSAFAQSAWDVQRAREEAEFVNGAYRSGTANLTDPELLKQVHPTYTPKAARAKIQGAVDVQVVVGVTGAIERARVTNSLDKIYGLDEQALTAVKQYLFRPGKLDGKVVPVVLDLTLNFKLTN